MSQGSTDYQCDDHCSSFVEQSYANPFGLPGIGRDLKVLYYLAFYHVAGV
jgi:hypothetical protein